MLSRRSKVFQYFPPWNLVQFMMMFDYQDRLAIPPRDIPFLLMLRIYFGGVFSQFGWIFFGFGLTFVWAFGVPENIASRFMFFGKF